jgi:hypothetical protein
MQQDVDINYGVDFERALERLSHIAGRLFRQYREAKHGYADAATIARLRQAYVDTLREQEALSPRDTAAIQAVLDRPQR